MRRKLSMMWVAALLVGGVGVGCNRQTVRDPKPVRDPLLISKKPVEGKPSASEPVQTVFSQPPAPPLPAQDIATATSLRPGTRVLGLQSMPQP